MLNIIQKLITWIAMGLFVGGGFAVAMYAVGYWATDIYAEKVKSAVEERKDDLGSPYFPVYKEYGPESGLVIKEHKSRLVPNSMDVLGKLQNEGTIIWESVQLEVELFDSSGNFVDECSEYMNGAISPGGIENFKVSCGRCDKNPLPEFKEYTIKIRGAHYKAQDSAHNTAPQQTQ